MKKSMRNFMIVGLAIVLAFAMFGCEGDDGAPGKAGKSTGTLTGTVTNGASGTGLADATVTTDPEVQGVSISTAANGTYSATLPAGVYTLTFSKANFKDETETVSILAAQTSTVNVTLDATSNVAVDAGADITSTPGSTVQVSVGITPLDGSTVQSILWEQTGSAPVVIADPDLATTDVTLASVEEYKAELYNHIEDLDRNIVQGVNPFALEEAGMVELTVTVTTDSGEYEDTVAIHADLSETVQVSTGINTVPVGVPVLLHGKSSAGPWNWTLTPPGGSAAALDSATSQSPSFTPDVAGTYTATVNGDDIIVVAGTWVGVIVGQDGSGNPVPDAGCTVCHNGVGAPDNFTPWAQSGHAEILTQNIDDPSGHWSLSCAGCHTVGYNTAADNGGFDDIAEIEGWSPPEHPGPGEWQDMLDNFPDTAQLANIQCENCHGPQNSTAHQTGLARVSLSADVCGSCHGEPKRHARFQQWAESAHGDYGFVTGASHKNDIGCNCHFAGAFIEWGEHGFDPTYEPLGDLFYGPGEGQPVTCVVCHDPHNPGDTSGEPNTATVRVEGTTPELLAGFIAAGVGRGATCMICHSGRRGAFNTTLHPMANGGTATGYLGSTLPHHATQGGIMMGENAYFVEVGSRSPHSFIVDTCTTCHMELTPPPPELSYNLAGTNHTFEASLEICSECHGTFDGGTLQESVAALNESMSDAISAALMYDINDIAAQADGLGGHAGAVLYDPSDDDTDGVIDPDPANGEVGAVITPANQIVTMSMPGRSGRFDLETTDATTLTSARTERFKVWVDDGSGAGTADDGVIDVDEIYDGDYEGAGVIDPTLASGAITTHGQTIQMAIWNHGMLYMDGSGGIHNPSFVIDILVNTTKEMNEVVAALTP